MGDDADDGYETKVKFVNKISSPLAGAKTTKKLHKLVCRFSRHFKLLRKVLDSV